MIVRALQIRLTPKPGSSTLFLWPQGLFGGQSLRRDVMKILTMAAVCWVITMLVRNCAKHLPYVIPISTSNDATRKPHCTRGNWGTEG